MFITRTLIFFLWLCCGTVIQGGHMTGKCWDAGISTFLAKKLGNAGIRTFEEKLGGKCWDLGFSPKKLMNKLTTFYKICTFFQLFFVYYETKFFNFLVFFQLFFVNYEKKIFNNFFQFFSKLFFLDSLKFSYFFRQFTIYCRIFFLYFFFHFM